MSYVEPLRKYYNAVDEDFLRRHHLGCYLIRPLKKMSSLDGLLPKSLFALSIGIVKNMFQFEPFIRGCSGASLSE